MTERRIEFTEEGIGLRLLIVDSDRDRLLGSVGLHDSVRGAGLRRVGLLIDPENAASLRVAEWAGFTREGVLRSHSIIKGRRRGMVSYSLLPDELAGGGGPAGRSTLKA